MSIAASAKPIVLIDPKESMMKTFKPLLVACLALFTLAGAVRAQEIFDAVKNGDLAKVKTLIEKDSSLLNIKDAAGNTPLHHAAIMGSVELAELLLSKGADINAVNAQQNTPLHEAIGTKKENVASLLIEKGADIRRGNIFKHTPLHRAASANLKNIGERLIAKGAEIDVRDAFGRTPFLIVARQSGDVEFGKLLLDHGAEINAKDRDNQKALNLAAWRGFNDFINFLLNHGAEYDVTNFGEREMLSMAAGCGSARLFKVALEKYDNLLTDDAFNTRILRTAVMGGSVEIVNILLAKNIPLNNDPNRYGWTPAHYAAENGHAAMIKFLVDKGIDLNKRTLSGKSVYNIAEENDQKEVLATIAALKGDNGPQKFPDLRGPYLGQTPPGPQSSYFAPDIVSSHNEDDNHGSIAFYPEGKEIYWNMKNNIWMTRLENDKWTRPEIVPFSRNQPDFMHDNPFITPDGKKMFFTSNRPGSVSERKENIWVVERTASGWGEPKPVSPAVNAMQLHWSLSVSNTGTLYFGGRAEGGYGGGDIYYSRRVNGEYTKPENLGPVINSPSTDHCPYISPDESYLIFHRTDDAGEKLYISFKGKEGQWLQPVKLNDELSAVCPVITPDGKYLFMAGVLWAEASFIEELRPKK